jgi:hypothetical protein
MPFEFKTLGSLTRVVKTTEMHGNRNVRSDALKEASSGYIYGSHRTRLRKSSGVQFSQAKSSPSIAAPIDREDGMSKTPGDSRVATKSRKWTLMVRRSAETSTRPSSAAIRKTSGSIAPSGIVPEAARKSIAGSLRSSPFRMSGSMSASA